MMKSLSRSSEEELVDLCVELKGLVKKAHEETIEHFYVSKRLLQALEWDIENEAPNLVIKPAINALLEHCQHIVIIFEKK